ncbi:4Fe-4S binding protein [Candidatus Calescamantes bacterium]|nr:4Fe-4S binding protein [Candidatus Calescamantes bacterium]
MKLKISYLRFTVQLLSLTLLTYGGYWFGWKRLNLRGITLQAPILSCHFNEKGWFICFLYDFQRFLTSQPKETFWVFLSFFILAIFLGRIWCGWICPLVTIQEIFIKLRSLVGMPYLRIPRIGKTLLKVVASLFLGTVVVFSFLLGRPFCPLYRFSLDLETPFCKICPGRLLIYLLQGKGNEFLYVDRFSPITLAFSYASFTIFSIFLAGITAIRKFWCRVCPLGLLLNLLHVNRLSPFSLEKNTQKCTSCGVCKRVCPLDLDTVYKEKRKANVLGRDCILCLKCVEACPEKDALKFTIFKIPIIRSGLML